jgi:nucleoside-diphosphate-sugar epimerase
VGSGTISSVLQIYQMLAEQIGSTEQPVFREDLPGEARDTLADTTAARTLGFAPRISLKDGLADSIRFFQRNVMSREQS